MEHAGARVRAELRQAEAAADEDDRPRFFEWVKEGRQWAPEAAACPECGGPNGSQLRFRLVYPEEGDPPEWMGTLIVRPSGAPFVLRCEDCRSGETRRKKLATIHPEVELAACGVNLELYGSKSEDGAARLENFDPNPDRLALDSAWEMVERVRSGQPGSLYLYSDGSGNGKTFAGVGIIWELIVSGDVDRDNAAFVREEDFISRLLEAKEAGEGAANAYLARFLNVKLLVMDDLGKAGSKGDWVAAKLYKLAERRQEKNTVWTSNFTLGQLKKTEGGIYTNATVSRITYNVTLVALTGRDRRGRKAKRITPGRG